MLVDDYQDNEFELQSAAAKALVAGLPEKCGVYIEGSLEAGEGSLALEDAAHFVSFYGATVPEDAFSMLTTLQRDYPRKFLPDLIDSLRNHVSPSS